MNRISRFASISLAALSLTACAALPAATPARVAKPLNTYESRASFAAPAVEWPSDAWWTAYNDPQLDTLIAEALDNSPTLAAGQARLMRAQSAAAGVRGAALPGVSLNGYAAEHKESYNNGFPREYVPQGYKDAGRLTLDFSWDLDFWGRNRAAIAAASSEARAVQAEAAAARLMLSAAVASAYADLGRQWALRDIAARAVELRTETGKLTDQRRANGAETQGAVSQASAELYAARAELGAQEEALSLARNQLAALLGAGPDRGLAITRPPLATTKPFGLPANVGLDLIGRRPDVTAARWRAEAANRRVGQARAAFFPNINLAAYFGVQALTLDTLFKNGSDIGQFGPAVSLPIFEGGRLRAGLRGVQAERDGAVAAFDGAVAQALREVADAAAGQRGLADRLSETRAAVAASEDAHRISRLRYNGGLGTYQSVLLAEQTLLAQRRTLATLESRALAADVAMVRALGGGYAADLPAKEGGGYAAHLPAKEGGGYAADLPAKEGGGYAADPPKQAAAIIPVNASAGPGRPS
jgi:NodT family efflux transporter outer membrane factor (OMF) lipoprotein